MGSLTNLSIMFFLIFLSSFSSSSNAATFTVRNNCPYAVWAAATPGGGRHLKQGQYWLLRVPAGTSNARIWGRTNCNFNASGHGHCETGDCGGLLHCESSGNPPNTLAEYSLNQHNRRDFISISLVAGFNIPLEFGPTNRACRGINCTADINGQCPKELTTPGGCHNPCTVFNTTEYCCTNGPGSCGPTDFSKFFKEMCPDAYSYPQDDPTSTISCPSGYTNYKVVFCPKTSFTSRFLLMEIV